MEEYICQYCGRKCKNLNSLRQHEIRCKENPNHIECCGNKGNMPKHIKNYYTKHVIAKDESKLNITNEELNIYKMNHLCCEICGKTIEESVKWKSKFAPKNCV